MYTRLLFLCTLVVLFYSCHSTEKDKEAKPGKVAPKIDFNTGSTIADFSVKTTAGKIFDTKNCKGKYWVVFYYNKSSIRTQGSFAQMLNQTAKQFKNRINFLGIVNGFVENENEVLPLLKNAAFNFPQVDNTISYEKKSRLNDNIFCTPAGIIIDPGGKVIYHSCGDIDVAGSEIRERLTQLVREKL